MVIAELDVTPAPGEPGDDPNTAQSFLRSLPPARFPRVIEAAGPLSAPDDPQTFYDLVIELILSGIQVAATRRRPA
jgi:TetR/AcrR family tetracycline transcriptional repressor